MKLCLHLSYIAQISFHFDEIFHRKFKLPILVCILLRRHLVSILGNVETKITLPLQEPSSASNAAQRKIKESQLESGQKITTLRTDTKTIVESTGLLSPKEMFPLSATPMNLIPQAPFVLRSPSKDPEDLYGTDVGDKSFEGVPPYLTLE